MLGRQNHDDFYVPSLAANQRIVKQYVINVLLLVVVFVMVVIADASILKEFVVKLGKLNMLIVEGCFMVFAEIYEGIASVLAVFFDFLWLIWTHIACKHSNSKDRSLFPSMIFVAKIYRAFDHDNTDFNYKEILKLSMNPYFTPSYPYANPMQQPYAFSHPVIPQPLPTFPQQPVNSI